MSPKLYEDDPILTAYALGELEADEAREVEARLADDAAARAYVEDVRRTAERLSAALRLEPVPVGGPSQAVEAAGGTVAPRWPWHRALAMAASLAVVGLIGASLVLPELNRARDSRDRVVALSGDEARGGPAEGLESDGDGWAGAFEREASDASSGASAQAMSARKDAGRGGVADKAEEGGALGQMQQRAQGQGQQQAENQALQLQEEAAVPQEVAKSAPATAAPAARERMEGKQLQAAGGAGGGAAPPPAGVADGIYSRGGGGLGGQGGLARPADDRRHADELDAGGRYRDDFNTEQYDRIVDNEFKRVGDQPLSTFSVDVDTASYSNTRRFLAANQLPPPDAVRIEELVNYFDYNYAPPPSDSQHPFSASVAVANAPWNPEHQLVRIGIKGREVAAAERPASNLVFLIDVSGSMQPENKLPLVKRAMTMLAQQLDERDRVAIVVYAGSSGLVLPSTSGAQRDHITGALARLDAGGSTNGGEGIQLAYQVARQNLIPGGVNRVILCTDGDFNIGVTDRGQLTRLIEEQAKSGVYLSILGFGMDNLKDATLEELTNKGEGNYGYIDTEHEARKLLVEQMQGTLQAIAKDVKIQVEFNPAEVGSYRLIGYENRILAKEDFNDDTKDAGDIGAGHEVTALYEVVPVEVQAKTNEARLAQLRDMEKKYLELQAVAGQTADGRPPHEAELAAVRAEIEALTKGQPAPPVDDLKYQERPAVAPAAASGELLTVKLRYKGPEEAKEQGTSALVEFPVKDEPRPFAEMDQDFQLAASAAGFGMLLRDSPHKGTLTWAGLDEMTRGIELLKLLEAPQPQAPVDPRVEELKRLFPDLMAEQRGEAERRTEFRELVKKAAALSGRP